MKYPQKQYYIRNLKPCKRIFYKNFVEKVSQNRGMSYNEVHEIAQGRVWMGSDGIGNGLGYGFILMTVAFIRELFGSGSLFGFEILKPVTNGGWYIPNGILVLPASGFFLIALIIWTLRTFDPEQQETK